MCVSEGAVIQARSFLVLILIGSAGLIACSSDAGSSASAEKNGGVTSGSTVSCSGGVCTTASAHDGIKDGDESDVDCGGAATGAPRCTAGKSCNTHADCVDGCGELSKTCVTGKSCTKHLGGDTCGATENASESCCSTAPLTGTAATIDKFYVTAGRMRAMIERLNGDVRSFVHTMPTQYWDASWDALVPSNMDEADKILGPYWENAPNDKSGGWSKYSCQSGQHTGHTYWVPDDTDASYAQADLDPKALNCVGWHMANAFCHWDGGRLPTPDEVQAAFTNNGRTTYPWGNDAPAGGDDDEKNPKQDPHFNHAYAYNWPQTRSNDLDAAVHVSPPGRFPFGNNENGVADLAGDLLPYVWDVDKKGKVLQTGFVWTFSWETHGLWWNTTTWGIDQNPDEPNGYYAIGLRCVRD